MATDVAVPVATVVTIVRQTLTSVCHRLVQPTTSVNRGGGYECFCHPKWPSHATAPLLATWQIVMISSGGGLFLVFLTLVFCKKL